MVYIHRRPNMKLFNMMIPETWIKLLKKKARTESVKRDEDVSVSLLIREALQEKYELKNDN